MPDVHLRVGYQHHQRCLRQLGDTDKLQSLYRGIGKLGKLLKNRVENIIRKTFQEAEFFEVECPIIMERKVWEAELDDLRSWAATVEAAKGSKRALAIAHWHAKIDEVAALYPEMTLACGFMRRAYRIARIVLADVHFENVGWAAYDMHETADYDFVRNDVVGLYPGQLKIFDPGHSSLTQAERRALERKIPPNPGIPPLRRR